MQGENVIFAVYFSISAVAIRKSTKLTTPAESLAGST